MQEPWKNWIPGVLSKRQVIELCKADLILEVVDYESSIDESSIDLTLTGEVYQLTKGSVKPFEGEKYLDRLKFWSLLEKVEPEGEAFVLKKAKTYLVRVKEKLSPDLNGNRIYGQATAKSSVGRVDVLVRTIIDGMSGYDIFDPNRTSAGEIFSEITPISYDVRIKADISLAQLRLFYGDPQHAEIRGEEICRTCILDPDRQYTKKIDNILSLNLEPSPIRNLEGVAFEGGEVENGRALDLWTLEYELKPKPWNFFKLLQVPEKRLLLRPSSFYILRSKERL